MDQSLTRVYFTDNDYRWKLLLRFDHFSMEDLGLLVFSPETSLILTLLAPL
jgi:hypothetical protein